MDIKKRIQELSLDQKAKLYFMGLVRQGKIDTLPEDPKAAYMDMLYKDLANVGKDTDDYGRSVSGKDKRTFTEPEDSMPAARAKKMMGLEEGYNKIANKLYGVNYDKLSPQEQEYVRDTIDREPGGAFNPRLSGMDEMQTVNKETGEDITKYVLQLLQGEISKEEFEKITGLKKEARDEEDEENDRNLASDDIPDSLKEIATELGYLEEIGMFHDPLGYEPEDMDNPDEDLVIIGSGYLDIKSNFGERPSMTNGEYEELGQKVVDQLHNGDKEAALNFIYSKIN